LGAKLSVMGFYVCGLVIICFCLVQNSADLDDDDDGIIEPAICGRNKH